MVKLNQSKNAPRGRGQELEEEPNYWGAPSNFGKLHQSTAARACALATFLRCASRLISPRHFSPSHVGATALKNPLTLSPCVPPLAFEKETLKKSVSSQQQRAFLWGPSDLPIPFCFSLLLPLFFASYLDMGTR